MTMKHFSPNPSGLCLCGCGERTAVARFSDRSKGWVKGQPRRFVQNHGARVRPKKERPPKPAKPPKPEKPQKKTPRRVPREYPVLPFPRLVYAPHHPAAVNGLIPALEPQTESNANG